MLIPMHVIVIRAGAYRNAKLELTIGLAIGGCGNGA